MIECIYYERKNDKIEIFLFEGLTTLEVTTLLSDSIRLKIDTLFSHAGNDYLTEETFSNFKTMEDFNLFFINNPSYHIHDCKLELENGIIVTSHDDGEVSIEQPIDFESRKIVRDIFRTKGLNERLMTEIMNLPGNYISLENGIIKSVYKTFDDYLKGTN